MDMIERILSLCDSHNISGVELGKSIGLKKSPLTDWKNKKSKPTVEQILQICDIFAVSTDYILRGSINKQMLLTDTPTENIEKDPTPKLSLTETSIIDMFRELDERDKEDIYDCLTLKYNRAIKRGKTTSYNSTYTGKNDMKKSDPDDHNSSSGIA